MSASFILDMYQVTYQLDLSTIIKTSDIKKSLNFVNNGFFFLHHYKIRSRPFNMKGV